MSDPSLRIERQVRFLTTYSAVLTLVLLVLGVSAFRPKAQEPGIIRALGIVIVDQEGRERSLLGAPIPEARNRVRTDPEGIGASNALLGAGAR